MQDKLIKTFISYDTGVEVKKLINGKNIDREYILSF